MRGKDLLECMEYIDDALIQEAFDPKIVPCRNSIVSKWVMPAACLVVVGVSAAVLWSHQNIKEEYSGSADNAIVASMAADSASENSAENVGNVDEDNCLTEALEDNIQITAMMDSDNNGEKTGGMEEAESEKAMPALQGDDSIEIEDKKSANQEALKMNYTIISDYSASNSTSSRYIIPEKGKTLRYQRLQEAIEYYSTQEKDEDSGSPDYVYTVVIDVFGDVENAEGSCYEHLNQTDAGNALIEQEYRRLIALGYSVRLSEDFLFTGTFTEEELDTFDALPEYGYVFRFENEG
ncbi:MAG: hypothetical protein K2N73_05900 [Lachnospiraceae bacterium]|nr:hypothetical protein [Lachnospiraceae bacterium]